MKERASLTQDMSKLGAQVRHLLLEMPGDLGDFARKFWLCRTSLQRAAEKPVASDRDILPLPFVRYSAEELKQHQLHPSMLEVLDKVKKLGLEEDMHDWAFLSCLLVNKLHLQSARQLSEQKLQEPLSACQKKALVQFHLDAACLVIDSAKLVPLDLPKLLGKVKLQYDGEVAQKTVHLTWAGVRPGLPPEALSGQLSAAKLASPTVQRLLLDPALSLLPKEEWPAKLKRPKVRATQEEWNRIGTGLVKRRIFSVIDEGLIIWHNGEPLLQGAFGIGKGKHADHCDYPGVPERRLEILRLIINLTASNELQRMIEADCKTLPHFGQWLSLELLESEVVMWRSEDMECCFYVFELPQCWWPYFVLGKQVDGKALGRPGEMLWLACSVLPMGWLSAVGICQHLHRRMLHLGGSWAPHGLPKEFEFRKDRPAPVAEDQRVHQFYQVYIDNFDSGEVVKVDEPVVKEQAAALLEAGVLQELMLKMERQDGECRPKHWQSWVRAAYEHWGAARSAAKCVEGEFHAATLGATIDGWRGRAGASGQRLADLAALSLAFLAERTPSRKLYCLVGGRWTFVLQFRKCLSCLFNGFWQGTMSHFAGPAVLKKASEEVALALCGLGCLCFDFRRPAANMVTCSDASEAGVGVCRSTGLTEEGHALLRRRRAATRGQARDGILLIELFGGIGGSRRAFELLGVEVECYIHADSSAEAQRVCQDRWPEAVLVSDVAEVQEELLVEVARRHPNIQLVVVCGGPPCQDVAGLNATRVGVSGSRSRLVVHMTRVRDAAKKVFVSALAALCTENVASMDKTDQDYYDQLHKRVPINICPSSFTWFRRPRLYWIDWKLIKVDGCVVSEEARWTKVKLTAPRPPLRAWLPKGVRLATDGPTFCTFVRCVPKKKPPFMPAGIHHCDEDTVNRWQADDYRYPPYQYQPKNMVKDQQGKLIHLPITAKELLMGFKRDHTYCCRTAGERRGHKQQWTDTRHALIGNSFATPVVAWLLSHLLVAHGMLSGVPIISDLLGLIEKQDADQCELPAAFQDRALRQLTRFYIGRQSHRGGELLHIEGPSGVKTHIRQSVDPHSWHWRVCVQGHWKLDDHINKLEALAYLASLRWRGRSRKQWGHRFLHLVDSVVVLGIMAKGHSSAPRLRGIAARVAAITIACHWAPVIGYIRSHRNPADRPSRAPKATVAEGKVTKKILKSPAPAPPAVRGRGKQ